MIMSWDGRAGSLVEYGGGSYKKESESLHRELYRFHDLVARRGENALKAALLTLHTLEADNADLRRTCRTYIAEFEELRDKTDELWHLAANLRKKLIEANGCDTSCEKP